MEAVINIAHNKVPTKSEIPPRLRHRSRCSSESEIGTTETGTVSSNTVPADTDKSKMDSRGRDDEHQNGPQINSRASSSNPDQSTAGHQSSRRSNAARKPYSSVLSLLGFELTRGYYLAGDETHYEERRDRVYTFMSTPLELERFCMFGFLQCVDTFLYFTAFLPIRIVIAFVHMLSYPCVCIASYLHGSRNSGGKQRRILKPAQVCDLLKGLLLGLAIFCIDLIDTSRMYHMVRGQAVIKLYVFYNMLDLADKLVSGAGQDMLDALYWTATEPGRKSRRFIFTTFHFFLALLYILIHTVLILGQATVLNVAFNSHSKALLTIMISNNFVEIKGSLFKRMDKNNLLQISCSDVKERFHYTILLFVVFVRNMNEFQWNTDQVWTILQDTLYVAMAEVVVDWVKHAFITKFNEISSDTYRTFKINLAQDILTSQQKNAHTDYSDQVCRRLGLTPIPMVCLLVQVCSKSIPVSGPLTYLLLGLFFLGLVTSKVLTSILLLSWGCRVLEGEEEEGHQTNPSTFDSQVLAKKDNSHDTTARDTPTRDTPTHAHTLTHIPRDRHSSERSTPLRSLPDLSFPRSVSEGETHIVSRSLVKSFDLSVGGDGSDTGWTLTSVSDSVVERQCQVLQREKTIMKNDPCMGEPLSSSDKWEVDSSDSDCEFHNSLDGSVPSQTVTVVGTPVVDYDDEKKFK